MDEMIAFLEARLDEDEAVIRENLDGHGLCDGFPDYRTYSDSDTNAADKYIDHFGPARALREVAAKRGLIRRLRTTVAEQHDHAIAALHGQLCDTIDIWRDHPDYNPEWAE